MNIYDLGNKSVKTKASVPGSQNPQDKHYTKNTTFPSVDSIT